MDDDKVVKLLTEIRELHDRTLAALNAQHAKLDKQRDEAREWALHRGMVPLFALQVVMIIVLLYRH